jgi:hypothetical protein
MQVMQRFVLIGMIAALMGVSLALTTPQSQGLPVRERIPLNSSLEGR